MSTSETDYLRHILDEANYLIDASRGLSYEDFIANPHLKHAFFAALCIIGEATKKISKDFRVRHPEVEWKKMAGMCDNLAHNYAGTSYILLFDVVVSKIPVLKAQVEEILAELSK